MVRGGIKMRINDIEKLTYDKAKEIALEEIQIKGHDCIFAELGEYFGYSVLVFKNGKHIYYADDYELHHKNIVKEKEKEVLKDYYITFLNNKLFTDEELLEEVKSYDEYRRKEYYLRNYWIMQYDRLSVFVVSDEAKREFDEKRELFPFYNPICFCFVSDEKIVQLANKYFSHINLEYIKLKDNIEEFRKMIAYELSNHEACVTCRYDETLDSLGLKFEDLTKAQQKVVIQELKKEINRYGY